MRPLRMLAQTAIPNNKESDLLNEVLHVVSFPGSDKESIEVMAECPEDAINKVRGMIEGNSPCCTPGQKTAYECLIEGGYEFIQAAPMDDGRFEVVLSKNGKTVTLLTEEMHKGDGCE